MVINNDLYFQISQFLYRDAALMDGKKYHEWLSTVAEDVTYRMENRIAKEKQVHHDTHQDVDYYIVDDRQFLETRIKREETDFAWSENPPTITRHFITNLAIEPGDKEDEVKVTSYVILYVYRLGATDTLTYERRDVLRNVDGNWKLSSRLIIPDQTSPKMQSISFIL